MAFFLRSLFACKQWYRNDNSFRPILFGSLYFETHFGYKIGLQKKARLSLSWKRMKLLHVLYNNVQQQQKIVTIAEGPWFNSVIDFWACQKNMKKCYLCQTENTKYARMYSRLNVQ